MKIRRSDNLLQTIAIAVMVFVWVWFFLGCSPVQDVGVCDLSRQQIEIQKSVMETQQRTIEAMQSQIRDMGRIIAAKDSSEKLCDSLLVQVYRMRTRFDPHARSDAQSILSIP